jgi:hypothetical protein
MYIINSRTLLRFLNGNFSNRIVNGRHFMTRPMCDILFVPVYVFLFPLIIRPRSGLWSHLRLLSSCFYHVQPYFIRSILLLEFSGSLYHCSGRPIDFTLFRFLFTWLPVWFWFINWIVNYWSSESRKLPTDHS